MSLPATTPTMSEHDARRITERIRLTAFTARESLEKLQALVAEAQEGQAHLALGYASWTAYLADVLGDEPLRLPRDQRQQLVGYLAGEGMSTRAIAPIVGADQATVVRDLRRGDANASPAPRATEAGRDFPPEPVSVDPVTGEVHDDCPPDATTGGEVTPPVDQSVAAGAGVEEPGEAVEAISPTPPARPAVTGLDGKTYTRPEPRKAQRRSLVDDARDAGQELRKALDRVERIAADDRLARNKDEVAAHLRHHLDRAQEVCQDLSELINN